MGGKIPAGALEVGRLPLELLRGGAYQGLAAALEDRRIVLRALPENGRLLYAVQALRDNAELLHELGELGLVIGLRLDLFELVESSFQPAPHHGHFRADLRALRLDRAPKRVERGGRVAGVLVQCLPCDSFPVVVQLRHILRAYLSMPIPRLSRWPRVISSCSSRAMLWPRRSSCPI